jgi:hypothetical protein
MQEAEIPVPKLEKMYRLRYVEAMMEEHANKLSELTTKIDNLSKFLLTRPSDFSELLSHFVDNTQATNDLKWTLKDTLKKLLDMNKNNHKIIPSPKRIEERINMSHYHPGIIPLLGETFLNRYETAKSTHNYHKFLTKMEIKDISTLDMKKKTIYPQMFAHFLYIFLQNPKNCAFHKKNDRCYACKSDNDYWEKVETDDFWTEVREFLWESYIAYVEQLEKDEFSELLIDRMHNINSQEIPVNKSGLIWLLYRQKQLPGQVRLGQLLINAYNSRNLRSAL